MIDGRWVPMSRRFVRRRGQRCGASSRSIALAAVVASSGILSAISANPRSAYAAPIQPGSKVEFKAVGSPSFLKIVGHSNQITGEILSTEGAWSGTLEVVLASLDTGIALRDEHMKERYLEVSKFPKARLVVDPVSWYPAKKSGEFSGSLTLHGVSQKITGEVEVEAKDEGSKIASTEFKIRLRDFGIQIPSFSGITVANEVTVKSEVVVP